MTLTALAAAWVGGLLLGLHLSLPGDALALWSAAGAALWAAWACHTRRWGSAATAVAAAALLLTGAWWGANAAAADPAATAAPLLAEDTVTVRGVIATDPDHDRLVYRFQLDAREWLDGETWREMDARLQVTARPSAAAVERGAPHFRYGDTVVAAGAVEAPPVFAGFDYREYLALQGVGALMRFPTLTVEDEGGGAWLQRQVYALRSQLAASLDRSLPEPAASLARGLLLGQRSGLPDSVRDAFIQTGTSHLLAISGLHVAIVMVFAVWAGRAVFGGARWALLAALVAVWLYALVSGLSPSVTRAAIMVSVFVLGRAVGREGASWPALAAAGAAMTALDPLLLRSVSFQLSFTAVAGLLLLAPPLEARLAPLAERFADADGAAGGLARATMGALAAGAAATLGTLPLVALTFERVSPLGIPVTMLALPALPAALVASAAAALGGIALAPAGVALGWIAWAPLTYLLTLAETAARIPGSLLPVGGVTPPLVVGYYALLAGAAYGLRQWATDPAEDAPPRRPPAQGRGARLRWMALGLALLLPCVIVWTAAVSAPDGRLTVTFLDVGQGDAIFITTPSGKQALIDGGPDPQRLQQEISSVMPFWDRTLDIVVLTHADADHLNGLVSTLERYDVDLVAEAGLDPSGATYAQWQRLLAGRGAHRETLVAAAGQAIHTGDGVVLDVLHPPADYPEGTPNLRNNGGVTLLVRYGGASFLLPADIHQYAEEALVAAGAPLQATVLKAAHHGSATSSSPAFLAAVNPRTVVISAGADNRFGHPAPEVRARLEDAVGAANVLVTAERGRVQFATDGVRLWRTTER